MRLGSIVELGQTENQERIPQSEMPMRSISTDDVGHDQLRTGAIPIESFKSKLLHVAEILNYRMLDPHSGRQE